jgi:3-methyladenine DNA glycosylase AlkD
MNTANQSIKKALLAEASPERAVSMQRFFKTGKGEYGEGDKFHGVSVPNQRLIAKKYQQECQKEDIIILLDSDFHEERLTGVFVLVQKFNTALRSRSEKEWVDLYIDKAERINNWDLVDSSAHLILGRWLENRDKEILYKFARSSSLWKNRIAVVSNLHFIRKNIFTDLFPICELMLNHTHDLMHKACGWMLREAWQREPLAVEEFLDEHIAMMPRTMLRYTIEKMPESKRKSYLNK